MALRATLWGVALYTGVIGLLFLLAQDLAATALEIELLDRVALRQVGATLLVLALLAALLSTDPLRYRHLLIVPLLGLLLHSAVLVYELATGASGLRQVGAPLAINLALLVLLVIFYPGRGVRANRLASASAADESDRPI